ncbi:MFS transporter [Tumebacillus algifaecis]|uniref:MFS transporter n=2 Tax=Tumebacillus algifaecis TaxID=1214604 RepID=A0A223D6I2_9BACL|nr:MFS transporter [Tumebacillus algifaecis]
MRPFRLYLGGNFLAACGEWLDMVALNWAVLALTGSPVHLGIINACRLIPVFLLSVPAGILADRFDRRKLLIGIQTATILLTLLIGWLFYINSPFWLFAVAVCLRAIFQTMDPPIRNSMIPNLVPEHFLGRAIAMNTAALNLSRIIGPAIAGVLLATLDTQEVIWLGAGGLLIEWIALYVLRPVQKQVRSKNGMLKDDLQEAYSFIKNQRTVQSLLLLAVVPMVFGFPYTSMLPVFVDQLMNLGPGGFGALLSVSAVGAVLGSLWLSLRNEQARAGRLLILSVLGFGLSLLLFVLSTNFWLAAAMMFLVGLTGQTYRTMSRITMQKQVPDHLRGRIMSIALMDRGFIPLGAIVIGAVAGTAGALWAGVMMGAGCLLVTLAVLFTRRQIWQI